ncbi:venom protease-like isoform X1 [Arctopsyche grandis]|uniref:venom protease-like isoform X1 n=1 Tax=Arctopsyche grandis TaxID=121162 RepID=UPI00406D7D3C
MSWAMRSFAIAIILFLFVFDLAKSQTEEGDDCILKNGLPGVCTELRFCEKLQKSRISREFCNVPVVCCPSDVTIPKTTQRIYIPSSAKECEYPSEAILVNRTKQVAWNKCIDLADSVFPCKRLGFVPGSPKIRIDTCQHTVKTLVYGGTAAERNEFPHMAALGYENEEIGRIEWDCGGTLISERWVMTAAHCMYNRQFSVKYVRLGALNLNSQEGFIYEIVDKKKHPGYSSQSKRNDIALLKINSTVTYSNAILPACIHVGNQVNASRAMAIGWGMTENGTKSDVLIKVALDLFTNRVCRKKYPGTFFNPGGISEDIQLCYGSKLESKDSCYGDSGGPIQVYNYRVHCTYTIIGITSKGRSCGIAGTPGIYTKVSAYVPWIESVVWPSPE